MSLTNGSHRWGGAVAAALLTVTMALVAGACFGGGEEDFLPEELTATPFSRQTPQATGSPGPVGTPTPTTSTTPPATATRTPISTPTPTAMPTRTATPSPTLTPGPPPTPTPAPSGPTFEFGEGVPLDEQQQIRDAVAMASRFMQSNFGADVRSVAIFAYATLDGIVDAYTRWYSITSGDAIARKRQSFQNIVGEAGFGVIFVYTGSRGWQCCPTVNRFKILLPL